MLKSIHHRIFANQAISAPKKSISYWKRDHLETPSNFDFSLNNNTLGLEQIKPKLMNMVALKRPDWIVDLKLYYNLGIGPGLLRQEDGMDVWQYASLRDGHPLHQFVELFVVPDGK